MSLSPKLEEYSQDHPDLTGNICAVATQTMYSDAGTQTDSFLLRNYLMQQRNKRLLSKSRGENGQPDIPPLPLNNDSTNGTLELHQDLMQEQMNKLRLMERDIDHENEIRLERVQWPIEDRIAKDESKIHKRILDLKNKGRISEFHLQQRRQAKNSNEQPNPTRKLLEVRENLNKTLSGRKNMNVFAPPDNTIRKKQSPQQIKPSLQKFKNYVETKAQLDQMSLILLNNKEKKNSPEGGRDISSPPPISPKVKNNKDHSKGAGHKE